MKTTALISLYSDDVKGISPLALLYLATALKKHGLDAKIIHKNAKDFNKNIVHWFIKRLILKIISLKQKSTKLFYQKLLINCIKKA